MATAFCPRRLLALALATVAFGLASCTSGTGPRYSEMKSSLGPQKGKGLVIIYWLEGKTMVSIPIYANNQVLTKEFKPYGFHCYQAPVGPLILSQSDLSQAGPSAGEAAVDNLVSGGLLGAAAGAIAGSVGASEEKKIRANYKPFEVKPGYTYYVEFKLNMRFMGPRPTFEQRTKLEAEADLEKCRSINPTSG
jgi:hypothetical protein